MDAFDIDVLGRYNAEVARGIMHTIAWREKMAILQEQFEEEQSAERADWVRQSLHPLPMGGWRIRWRWYNAWVGVYFGPGEVFICLIPFLCISYVWKQAR